VKTLDLTDPLIAAGLVAAALPAATPGSALARAVWPVRTYVETPPAVT
jgi:hypothetical protein